MPLAAVPTRVSSFRLLELTCQKGVFVGSDCNNNALRDETRVKRGDTVGLCTVYGKAGCCLLVPNVNIAWTAREALPHLADTSWPASAVRHRALKPHPVLGPPLPWESKGA